MRSLLNYLIPPFQELEFIHWSKELKKLKNGCQKQEEEFQHFKMIESICKETQKETFKTILKDALHTNPNERPFRNKGKDVHRRPPPRDF